MGVQCQLERGLAHPPAPMGAENKELSHEPTWRAAGERAVINDQSKAGNLVVCLYEIGMAPKAIEKAIFKAAVVTDGKRHELGQVMKVELDKVGD